MLIKKYPLLKFYISGAALKRWRTGMENDYVFTPRRKEKKEVSNEKSSFPGGKIWLIEIKTARSASKQEKRIERVPKWD